MRTKMEIMLPADEKGYVMYLSSSPRAGTENLVLITLRYKDSEELSMSVSVKPEELTQALKAFI